MIYPSMTKEKTTTTLNDGLSNYTVLYLGVLLKPCTGEILKKMSTKLIIQFCYYSQPRPRLQTTTDSAILAQSDIGTCGTAKP